MYLQINYNLSLWPIDVTILFVARGSGLLASYAVTMRLSSVLYFAVYLRVHGILMLKRIKMRMNF